MWGRERGGRGMRYFWWGLHYRRMWREGPWEGDAFRLKVSCGKVAPEPLKVWPADSLSPLKCLTEKNELHLEEAEEGDR